MIYDVFISYRGADRLIARKLEHRLRGRWGSRVFLDEQSLMAGQSWSEQLHVAMQRARVMLALIGPGWEIRKDRQEKDWVYEELTTALHSGIPILPVFVGNPDDLKHKLADLPEAFKRQAVEVGPELAGFDLHEIGKALRSLGAFQRDKKEQTVGLSLDLLEIAPPIALQQATGYVQQNRSLLVIGRSGSGRRVLLHKLIESLPKEDYFIATYGVDRAIQPRRTHGVIASWIETLSNALQLEVANGEDPQNGRHLVHAVIKAGPDLLSRQVVRAATLLPLGTHEDDRKILETIRRPKERWAPFPPQRLLSQSRGVLDQLQAKFGRRRLMLVVDDFDSVDDNSRELVMSLVKTIRDAGRPWLLMIAVSDAQNPASRKLKQVMGLDDAQTCFELINVEAAASWVDPHVEDDQNTALKSWLTTHRVELEPVLRSKLQDFNPYWALSKLWYLVDHGYVEEVPEERPDQTVVTWRLTDQAEAIQEPTAEQLRDHMIREHIPAEHRPVLQAGALIGRSFSFYAAFAAAHPPETAGEDDPPSPQDIECWNAAAEDTWHRLKSIDPDQVVLQCRVSQRGEKLVSLAQADLVGHLRTSLDRADARRSHERLAGYFAKPYQMSVSDDFDDQYRRADQAARHWAEAGHLREAADAHHRAADIAERGLAYRDARSHYTRAIRFYTQLLTEGHDRSRDREDLLIMSHSLYRLGQMMRLAAERSQAAQTGEYHDPKEAVQAQREDLEDDPKAHLKHALVRLHELRDVLINDDDNDDDIRQSSRGILELVARDIPKPGLVRHYLRLYQALSGHVNLELVACHKHDGDKAEARNRLFDALRNAEAARGEAGSHWLLTSASTQLADQMVDAAIRCQKQAPLRSSNLAVEAFFHIERTMGLKSVTLEEERDLVETRSDAWRLIGRLFRHLALQPKMAEWAFRKMNDHGKHVTTKVDKITDRWLGFFLLSICTPGVDAKPLREARELLEGYRDWRLKVVWPTPWCPCTCASFCSNWWRPIAAISRRQKRT